jgi:hypothetical protein
MTQTIEYVVKVNATQAQAAVAEVEKRFGGVDTVVARVDKSIIALERDMKDLNAAIAAGGPNVAAYQKELDNLGQAAGRAAGNKNMGQGMLQLSQTFDDLQYGIKGVVNNIPGLVQGFGVSAGIAGGAQLAFIAVNQLTDKLTDYIKKQQEASQAAIKGRLSLLDARVQAMQETADLQAELDRITAEISGGTGKVTEDASKARLADLRTNITNAEQDIAKRQGQLQMLERMQFRSDVQDEQIKATKAYIQDRRNRIAADNAAIDQEVKNQEIRVKIAKASEELANKAGRPSGGKGSRYVEGVITAEYDPSTEALSGMFSQAGLREKMRESQAKRAADLENEIRSQVAKHEEKNNKEADRRAEQRRKDAERAEQLHLSRLEQLEGESLAARMAFDTVAMNHKMDNLDKLKAHEFKNLKDNVKQYEGMYNDLGQLAQGATTTMIGASEDYFKAKIEGAENAEMIAAAAVLSGIGDQLVGLGTKYLFEGAGMSLLGDPRGPAMLGLGGLTIAAGVGMGAGSAAISHTAAGGTIGKALPDDKATKDPGASPRSSGGGGGGGPLIVNVAYGAGGPLPEDIAREIHKVTSSGNRRRGAA